MLGLRVATLEALAVIDASLTRVVDAVERVEAADPGGPGAILAITADQTLPIPSSTVSQARTAASQTPVWPTMSGLA